MAYTTNGHHWKWDMMNMNLHKIGYSVQWQQDFITREYKYAISKGNFETREVISIHNNEAEAEALCNLLITQSRYEV